MVGAVGKQVQELEQAVRHQRRQAPSDEHSRKEYFLQLLGHTESPVGSKCIFSP